MSSSCYVCTSYAFRWRSVDRLSLASTRSVCDAHALLWRPIGKMLSACAPLICIKPSGVRRMHLIGSSRHYSILGFCAGFDCFPYTSRRGVRSKKIPPTPGTSICTTHHRCAGWWISRGAVCVGCWLSLFFAVFLWITMNDFPRICIYVLTPHVVTQHCVMRYHHITNDSH